MVFEPLLQHTHKEREIESMNLNPVAETSEKLITPEQAADLLQVSKRTMYEWLRNGEIPSVRVGERLLRVRESDVLKPDVRAYLEQGMLHDSPHPHEMDQAVTAYNKAIQLNPRYTLAYFCLGTMYYRWGHYHKAIEPLKKAIELNPEAVPSYMNLGMNYNHAGMYSDAEEILKKAVELNDDHAEAHYQLGFALLQQYNKYKGAIRHFKKAVALDPKHVMATHFLGFALVVKAGDFTGARQLQERIKDTHPQEAEHIGLLISLNEKHG
jgi:excisionase family DNA binding protein